MTQVLRDNRDGCKEFRKEDFLNEELTDQDSMTAPVIIVDRGNCTFVTKTSNVEKIGGRFALIVDNVLNENPESIVMIDDGRGSNLRIPAYLISHRSGKLIKKSLSKKDHVIIKAA